MRARLLIPILLVVVATGCSNTPTAPSEEPAGPPEFASQVTPGGTASRVVTLRIGGAIAVTLTSVTPSAVLGLGIGIPRSGGGCSLSQSITTGPGPAPQLSVTADAGEFCVQVYDPAMLSEPVSFAVTIAIP